MENTIVNDKVTIGLAGYCSRTVTIKKLPLFMKYKGDCHSYASELLTKKNYINTRLHAKQRNKRERRVLNDSLFAYISNMGTDHSKLITRLTNSKNVLLNHKRRYRTEYDKLCNDEATSSLPSYRNAFLSITN